LQSENSPSVANQKALFEEKTSVNSPMPASSRSGGVFSASEVEQIVRDRLFQLEDDMNQRLKDMEDEYENRLAVLAKSTSSIGMDDIRRVIYFLRSKYEQDRRLEQTICQSLESASQQQRQLNDRLSEEQDRCRRIAEALNAIAQANRMPLPDPLPALLSLPAPMILPPLPVPKSLFNDRPQFEAEITWLETILSEHDDQETPSDDAAPLHAEEEMITDTPEAPVDSMDLSNCSHIAQSDDMMVDTSHSGGLACEENLDAFFEAHTESIVDNSVNFFPPVEDPFPPKPVFASPEPRLTPRRNTPRQNLINMAMQQQKLPTIIVTPPHEAPPPRRRQSTGRAAAAAAAIAAQPPPAPAPISPTPAPTPVPTVTKQQPPTQQKQSADDSAQKRKIRKITPPQQQQTSTTASSSGSTIVVTKKGSVSGRRSSVGSASSAHTGEADLFAQNLPDGVNLQILQQYFTAASQTQVTGFVLGAKGTGFITFASLDQAQRGLAACNKTVLGDKIIQLSLDKK
jgi:hypothetical protein